MALVVESKVDPRDLRANIRHKGSQALPKKVRDAMANLTDDVFEASHKQNYQPVGGRRYLSLYFFFPDMRCDLDGPIKHTIDSLQHGLRKAGHADWNDRSIWHLSIYRVMGEPQIRMWLTENEEFE